MSDDRAERHSQAQQVFNQAHALRQQGQRAEAVPLFREAVAVSPRELRVDRTWTAYAAYQGGVNLMTLHGLDQAAPANLSRTQARGLEELRTLWTEMMDLIVSVNRQDVRAYDTTPQGCNPILSTAIRTVVEDPLLVPLLRPSWLCWTRRFLGWPIEDAGLRGVEVADTPVDRLVHLAMVLNKEHPGDQAEVMQTAYSERLLEAVIKPIYMSCCERMGDELDMGIEDLSPEELDLFLNASMEGATQVLICHQHGGERLDESWLTQLFFYGRELCELNLRLINQMYCKDLDGQAASRAILDIYGFIMYGVAMTTKEAAAAMEAERMFAFYRNERGVHECRMLVQHLTHA